MRRALAGRTIALLLTLDACTRSPRVEPEPAGARDVVSFGTARRTVIESRDASSQDATAPNIPTIWITYTDTAGELSADDVFRAGANSLVPSRVEFIDPALGVEPLRWGPHASPVGLSNPEQRWRATDRAIRARIGFERDAAPSVEIECEANATGLAVLSLERGAILSLQSAGRTRSSSGAPAGAQTAWRYTIAPDGATATRCHHSERGTNDDRAELVVAPRGATVGPSLHLGLLVWREVIFVEQQTPTSRVELGVADCGFRFRDDDARAIAKRAVAVAVHPSLSTLTTVHHWDRDAMRRDVVWTSRVARTERAWICIGTGPAEASRYGETAVPRLDQRRYVVAIGGRAVAAVIRPNQAGLLELAPTSEPPPRTVVRCCRNPDRSIVPCDRVGFVLRVAPRFVRVPNVRRAGCDGVYELDYDGLERNRQIPHRAQVPF
ncbi:MAG: hypothetical protein JNK05_07485 [Myxococcales bacterium]|nr:hypothetical protein [Myxococcales bacterium]